MPLVNKYLHCPKNEELAEKCSISHQMRNFLSCKQYLKPLTGSNWRQAPCLNRFRLRNLVSHFLGATGSAGYQGDLKPSNESFEVFIARPVAARRANQIGARKGTYDNVLRGEAVDKGLRLVSPPGDQGCLVGLGDYVGPTFTEQRTAALGRLARTPVAV